jgi:hypothetical protein
MLRQAQHRLIGTAGPLDLADAVHRLDVLASTSSTKKDRASRLCVGSATATATMASPVRQAGG